MLSTFLRYITLILLWFISHAFLFSQNVNYEVEVLELRCNILSDGIFGGPDPTWKVWANDDTDPIWSGGQCIYRDDVTLGSFTLDTLDPSGQMPYNIRQITNSSAQNITLKFEGFEKDCAWFGATDRCTYDGCCDVPFCFLADEFLCQTNNLGSIQFRNDPQCQWNYYGWFTCGLFDVKIRVRWEFATSPPILIQPTALTSDTTLCAPLPLSLSVTSDTSAQHFQWQISTNTAINPNTPWQNIQGANSSTFLVPVISGTRNYRVLVGSSCLSNPNTNSTISESVRVTYQPYPPSNIVSSLCGSTVMPNSTHHFSVSQPPDSNAILYANYQWSGSQGLIIHTPNAASTDITFPSYGFYQIQVTYGNNCGTITSSPSCQVMVGSDHCDYVYVSPVGIDTSTAGTPNNPVKTLAYALTMATGSRNTIRMHKGVYNETDIIHLKDDLTIDGGYVATPNGWIKSSSDSSIVYIEPPLEVILADSNTTIGIYRGLVSNNVSNWGLQDLHILVKINGASGATNRNGHSVYGLHISGNSQNYLISRSHIHVGRASNGVNGLTGADGQNGNNGGHGLAGGVISGGFFNCDSDANGHGGIGGGTVGGSANLGGAGGNGGRGGYEEFSSTASGENGFDGLVGGGIIPGGNGLGNGGTRYSNCIPADGIDGAPGNDGTNGLSYTLPAQTNFNFTQDFWVPAYGLNGGDGFGGGGGQGGGGASGQGTGLIPFCVPGRGNGGGGGGSGGQGGSGGEGGGGGGASIAIYASGNTQGAILSSNISMPNTPASSGGLGNIGGNGGQGGFGGIGDTTCFIENGKGGNGGQGGQGGQGGKGQDGAEGIIIPIALGPNAQLNGSVSTIPHPTNISINYYNERGCTFSELEITKGQGLWGLPNSAYYVNNLNTNLSSFTNVSDTALIYFDSIGVYDITANNGVFETFIRITDNRTLPQINIDNNPSCFDSIITLSSNIPALDYNWIVFKGHPDSIVFTSILPSPTIQSLLPDTYTVRLQQKDICCGWSIPIFKNFTVLLPLDAGLIGFDTIICFGQSLDSLFNLVPAQGGSDSGYAYQWYISDSISTPGIGNWMPINGAQGIDLLVPTLYDTTYFVREVINSCGSLFSNIITVIVSPQLNPGLIAADTVLCAGQTPNIFMSISNASGGSGTISYQWYYSHTSNIPGTGSWSAIPLANNATYQAPALFQTSYFVREVIDSCGHAYSNIITIIVDSLPLINAGTDQHLCSMLSFVLNGQSSTGSGTWQQISGPIPSTFTPNNQALTPTVSVTQYGIYMFEWQVQNGLCVHKDTVVISASPPLSLNVNPFDTVVCIGTPLTLNVSGAQSYVWQPVTYLSDSVGSTVTATPMFAIQYTVLGTDTNGCTGTATISISVDQQPIPNAGNDTSFCQLLNFQLNGSVNTGSGSWHMLAGSGSCTFTPANTFPNPVVNCSDFGTYIFQWHVVSGSCSDSAQVTVVLSENPIITLNPSNADICEGGTITLVASGADYYLWQPPNFLSIDTGDVVIANPHNTIQYTVTATSLNGCTASAHTNINVYPYPHINFADTIYLCEMPTVILDAGLGYQNYIWSTGSQNQSIEVTQAGVYGVMVDHYGCIGGDTVLVLACIEVTAPSVFTPNGDGINDVFFVDGNFVDSFYLTIFNRWGKKVFETNDIKKSWDGTYKGEPLAEGTYYWVITYTSGSYKHSNQTVEVKGWVQLIR